MSRLRKALILALLDALSLQLAALLAFLLRFDFALPGRYVWMLEPTLPVLAVVRLAVYSYFGLYAVLWEYASLPELWAIVRAGAVASAVDWLFLHYALADLAFPRSVTLIMWAVNIGLCSTVRFSARVRQEWAARWANRSLNSRGEAGPAPGPGRAGTAPVRKARVLLVGAG